MTINKPTILIVDDEPVNIKILNEILKQEHQIKVANNGRQAINLAHLQPLPDMILLDLLMPDMDGFTVCEQLKKSSCTRDIPIIFITASDAEEDENKGFEVGAVDFITRPFSPSIVQARVKNHLLLLHQKRELQRMHQEVLALSLTDSLTGLSNRRRLNEFINQEWIRALRNQIPIGILFIDLDHFKNYNDYYGHTAGDHCLQAISRVLQNRIREQDLSARYGGEEFICILLDTDIDGVIRVGSDILRQIREMNIPHANSAIDNRITLSMGGTAIIPNSNIYPDSIIETADKLLYIAKKEGRDRLVAQAYAPV